MRRRDFQPWTLRKRIPQNASPCSTCSPPKKKRATDPPTYQQSGRSLSKQGALTEASARSLSQTSRQLTGYARPSAATQLMDKRVNRRSIWAEKPAKAPFDSIWESIGVRVRDLQAKGRPKKTKKNGTQLMDAGFKYEPESRTWILRNYFSTRWYDRTARKGLEIKSHIFFPPLIFLMWIHLSYFASTKSKVLRRFFSGILFLHVFGVFSLHFNKAALKKKGNIFFLTYN